LGAPPVLWVMSCPYLLCREKFHTISGDKSPGYEWQRVETRLAPPESVPLVAEEVTRG